MRCRVVLGDARLSLARAPLHGYGLIVLDAFSSDAIPIHLMTNEALGLYLSRLAPGGALAFHISNRHLTLAPVLARLALEPRTRRPPAKAHRRSNDHARAVLVRVDGDGQRRERSRIAGERRALEHAGDSAVDAVVDG